VRLRKPKANGGATDSSFLSNQVREWGTTRLITTDQYFAELREVSLVLRRVSAAAQRSDEPRPVAMLGVRFVSNSMAPIHKRYRIGFVPLFVYGMTLTAPCS